MVAGEGNCGQLGVSSGSSSVGMRGAVVAGGVR